jgi:transcriptional regulator with XRE-family HTH domain
MTKDLSPLGALLEEARKRAKLSQNAAAKRAGVSGTAWRRVIKGMAMYGGVEVPYPGKAATVAQMARAVGVTAEELEKAGRPDAAEEWRADISAPRRTPEESIESLRRSTQTLRETLERLRTEIKATVGEVVDDEEDPQQLERMRRVIDAFRDTG